MANRTLHGKEHSQVSTRREDSFVTPQRGVRAGSGNALQSSITQRTPTSPRERYTHRNSEFNSQPYTLQQQRGECSRERSIEQRGPVQRNQRSASTMQLPVHRGGEVTPRHPIAVNRALDREVIQ